MAPAANISYLDGPDELVSETIRSLIASNWDPSNTKNITPKFISQYGKGTDAANENEEATANDLAVRHDENVLRFLNAGTALNANGQSSLTSAVISTVKIDIFGQTQALRERFAAEVNRIIFQNQPSQTVRIPKSTSTQQNPANSAIAQFITNMIEWSDLHEFTKNGIIGQITGSLKCEKLFYK